MSVAAAGDVFAAGTEFHRNSGFVDEFARMGSNDVNSEDSVCGLVGEYLYESVGVSGGTSPTVRGEIETTGSVFDTGLLQSVLIGARRCNFGLCVYDGGNCPIVDVTVTRHHLFDARNAFFFRFVSQHGSANHIAHSIDARRARLVTRVDLDKATLVGLHSGVFKAQTVSTRLPAYSNEHSITGDRFCTFHLDGTCFPGCRD